MIIIKNLADIWFKILLLTSLCFAICILDVSKQMRGFWTIKVHLIMVPPISDSRDVSISYHANAVRRPYGTWLTDSCRGRRGTGVCTRTAPCNSYFRPASRVWRSRWAARWTGAPWFPDRERRQESPSSMSFGSEFLPGIATESPSAAAGTVRTAECNSVKSFSLWQHGVNLQEPVISCSTAAFS